MNRTKEVRQAIIEAEATGRYAYVTWLIVNTIGLQSDKALRVIAVRTRNGQTECKTINADWLRLSPGSVVYVQ